MKTFIVGEGKIVGTVGTSNGFPAFIIEPAIHPGHAGESADREPKEVSDEAVVLEIHASLGVAVLIDGLREASKRLEANPIGVIMCQRGTQQEEPR